LIFLGDTADWTYFVVPEDAPATRFSSDLDEYESGQGRPVIEDFFSTVESITPYGPQDRRGPGLPQSRFDGTIVVDAFLWPSPDQDEAGRRIGDVQRVLRELGGEVLATDTRPLTAMARMRVNSDALNGVLDLSAVERVRTPVAPFLEPSDWFHATPGDLTAGEPLDVVVGVIDDGVHLGHPLLTALVVHAESIPTAHQWADPGQHGSMVAGLAAYGDFEVALRDHAPLARPARLAVVRVLEPDGNSPLSTRFPTDTPLHVVMEQAIRSLHAQGVRIINISITDPDAYSGPHVSLWTETLDQLARDLKLVIVVAAGNRQLSPAGQVRPGVHAHTDYPTYVLDQEARIAEPAVGANVLTVGSLARSAGPASHGGRSRPENRAIAAEMQLSPFSRTGPGLDGTHQRGGVKPEFVHFGGNLVWTGLGQIADRDPGTSVVSTVLQQSGRLFAVGSGTSFAAPRVARAAAEVAHCYPAAGPNLIRALLGVSALVPPDARRQFPDGSDSHRAFGYGMPDPRRAVESDLNRVVLTWEGTIAVNTAVIHPVPVPMPFARGRADRTITSSIAFDPPVRRQRREYIAGHLAIDFYRAMTIDEVEEIVRRQEGDDRVPIPEDRRRIVGRLLPGPNICGGSTLQVRRWDAPAGNSLDPDDSDTYFLVVKHIGESWAGRLAKP